MSKRPPRRSFLVRLYGLWLMVHAVQWAFGAAISQWVLAVTVGLWLLYPRIRRVRITTDRHGIDIRWSGREIGPQAARHHPAVDMAGCAHRRAEPVESGGERVAWLCPDCDEQLPANFRHHDEREERIPQPHERVLTVVERRDGIVHRTTYVGPSRECCHSVERGPHLPGCEVGRASEKLRRLDPRTAWIADQHINVAALLLALQQATEEDSD